MVVLQTINQILTAGIAITAFSLLLYAMTFNLRDRVARSFAIILVSVVIIFTAEAIGSTANLSWEVEFFLRLQWVGLILLPAGYLHFSDALLATTGKPSRGKRRWAIRFTYIASLLIILTLPITHFWGEMVLDDSPIPYLQKTPATNLFTLYYVTIMVMAWFNFYRAFRRTTTPTSRRRMIYLLAGATAPALGSYPYLLFGADFAIKHQLFFWLSASINSFLVGGLVVVMAYAVAFFGVPWPDRVVKGRLFKWLMRGPVTASIVLGLTTIVRRAGTYFGAEYWAAVPIVMVSTILLLEYAITLFSPLWERWLFYGNDRNDLSLLQDLEDRLFTRNDLRQFLEIVLAAVCDRLQTQTAFVAALYEEDVRLIVKIGHDGLFDNDQLVHELSEVVSDRDEEQQIFRWGEYYLVPLYEDEFFQGDMLGLLGAAYPTDKELDDEQLQAFLFLAQRSAMALRDRRMQQKIIQSLQTLNPQVDLIQRLRAASRYDGTEILMGKVPLPKQDTISQWVKDALTHYWGGPKLTESPLMQFRIVRNAVSDHEGNDANALRAILRQAIEKIRPEGERRFNGEWILYNILEMKFMEGRKVREVALRLAMSEADLYRKQRVAIETVSRTIMEMEQDELENEMATNSESIAQSQIVHPGT